MNIHLPAILGFTRYQGFDPSPSEASSIIGGPPFTIAKLVNITPISLWFMVRLNNYSYKRVYKPTYN